MSRPHAVPVAYRMVRNTTVVGAASELVAALQLIVKQPLGDCGPTNRYIYFVTANLVGMHDSFYTALVRQVAHSVSLDEL